MFEEKRLMDLFESLRPEQQTEAIDFMEHLKKRQSQAEVIAQNLEAIHAKDEPPLRKFGSMRGLVLYMADDFNEPLEDFAEYM